MTLKRPSSVLLLCLLVFALALVAAPGASAEESKFRQAFKESYEKNAFKSLEFLIKRNASKVGPEVDAILKEAADPDLTYPERMHLIDLAVTMASIHKEWNKDAAPLARAEAVQMKELKKEQARQAEIKKWKAYELVLGNWVMKENKEKMEAEGLPYVLYPHWMHQIFFECRICHTGIFIPKRGANAINKKKILEGKLCGRCHNGKIAFEPRTNCKKCHVVNTPEEKKFRDVDYVDMEMIKKSAARLGVEWHPEKLPDGKIPVDRFNFVDWGMLNKLGVYKSVSRLDGIAPATEKRETKILYPSSLSFIKDAVFDHAKHTPRMLCVHCHPMIFKAELGANTARMSEMGTDGAECGYCHGKTAFKLADCNRCHSHPQSEPTKGMLIHEFKGTKE